MEGCVVRVRLRRRFFPFLPPPQTFPNTQKHTQSQANDALRRGTQLRKKFYLREALTLYTKALSALSGKGGDGGGPEGEDETAAAPPPPPAAADDPAEAAALRVVLLSNRAQAHLTLDNNRAALEDATAAGASDPGCAKAHYRAARAAGRLGEWAAAAAACERGLAASPGDTDFKALQASIAADRAKREADAAAAAAAAAAARAPARALAAAVAARSVRVGLPQFTAAVGARRPWLEGDTLHWPLLLAYPEAGPGCAPDVIEAVPETDALSPHLDAVFGPGAPPLPWDDGEGGSGQPAYTRSSVELYYLSHATAPLDLPALAEALHGGWPEGVSPAPPARYGPTAARLVRVREDVALGDLLARPDMVVPGVPVFFVVAKGTAFRERWLAADEW
jgi:tetratricopeptide (TPR) repeat protein